MICDGEQRERRAQNLCRLDFKGVSTAIRAKHARKCWLNTVCFSSTAILSAI